MRIRRGILEKRARQVADGYLAECLAAGIIAGDFLLIDGERYAELCAKYRGPGDILAAAIKPFAAVIDSVFGTDLKNCVGCDGRRKFLNTLTHPHS